MAKSVSAGRSLPSAAGRTRTDGMQQIVKLQPGAWPTRRDRPRSEWGGVWVRTWIPATEICKLLAREEVWVGVFDARDVDQDELELVDSLNVVESNQ
jgi:hypothetical protein